MKEYFKRLVDYDRYANLLIIDAIRSAPNQQAVKSIAHMLVAQQTWLKRCKFLPAPVAPLWPDWPLSDFKEILESNYAEWSAFIQQTEDWQQQIIYKNTSGQEFSNNLSDIIAHVINHGTHHRAQAGVYLRLTNVEKLPVTDYIMYARK